MVIPMTELTVPITLSDALDSIIAGKAALYILATRLMAARKSIRWKMPGFLFNHRIPTATLCRMLSCFCSDSIFGMGINNSKTTKAIAKLIKSMAMTVSIPHRPRIAVVMTGVRMEFRELERYLMPPTF